MGTPADATIDHSGMVKVGYRSVNSTSAWIPILSAVAALFGAAVGAMLQGRYGVTGWRRQIRFEAYTRFLNDAHDFDSLLFDILNTPDESDFNKKRQQVQETYSRLQSTGTLVAIAGPKRVDVELTSILKSATAVVKDMRTTNAFMALALEWKKDKSYDNLAAWYQSVEQFTDTLRRTLRTE